MRITYRRHLEPEIDLASQPQPEIIGGVAAEWTVSANRLTHVSFSVSNVVLDKDSTGTITTYNDGVMSKVFAAARFVGDRLRIQTGFDAIQAFAFIGNTPDDVVGETPQEEAYLQKHVKRGQRSIMLTATITRPFDPNEYKDFDRLSVPVGHFARAQRATDSLEKFEDYFKALEYFAARRPGDDPSSTLFDQQLSVVTKQIDGRFDQGRIKAYRELRRRVVHTRTTHALGHIGPTDIAGIRQVQAMLPEMEQLVLALLRNPPAFPR